MVCVCVCVCVCMRECECECVSVSVWCVHVCSAGVSGAGDDVMY